MDYIIQINYAENSNIEEINELISSKGGIILTHVGEPASTAWFAISVLEPIGELIEELTSREGIEVVI